VDQANSQKFRSRGYFAPVAKCLQPFSNAQRKQRGRQFQDSQLNCPINFHHIPLWLTGSKNPISCVIIQKGGELI
jgi:hypothetical protein